MIDSLFDSLFESSQLTSELTPDLKEYSQLLYEFLNASPQDMRKVVDCAVDARPYLNVSSKNPKTKGKHILGKKYTISGNPICTTDTSSISVSSNFSC